MEGDEIREETTFCFGVIDVGDCSSAGQPDDLACLLV